MECWNLGILEEDSLGRDERLLVLGTQARAPPRTGIPSPPSFQHSHIPTFQFEVIDKRLYIFFTRSLRHYDNYFFTSAMMMTIFAWRVIKNKQTFLKEKYSGVRISNRKL